MNLLRLTLIIPKINNKLAAIIKGIKLAFIAFIIYFDLLHGFERGIPGKETAS